MEIDCVAPSHNDNNEYDSYHTDRDNTGYQVNARANNEGQNLQIESDIRSSEGEDKDDCEEQAYRTVNIGETLKDSEHPYFPQLVLDNTIGIRIRSYPFMIYALRELSELFLDVERKFRDTVESIGYPSIYLNPALMSRVLKTLTVRRLFITFGRGSGLIMTIRDIFSGSYRPLIHAWLILRELDQGWLVVRGVRWR